MKFFISISLVLCLISGCGGIPKETLAPVETSKLQTITLNDDYSMFVKVPVGTNTLTISKGKYRALGQNSEGTFYVGPKDCLFWEGPATDGFTQQCGLFVSHKPSSEVKLFYFESGEEVISGAFATSAELLRSQSMNFHIYTRQSIPINELNQNGL